MRVCVFSSASRWVDPGFFDVARRLGAGLARGGHTLVYGGNDVGPMGAIADAAREAGGRVIGVTPQFFVDEGVADHKCDELVVCRTMRERKQLMEDKAEAFVALAGGIGTLEELIECLVARQLGYHQRPILLVNTRGFWNPLLAMLREQTDLNFVRPNTMDLLQVVETPEAAIESLSSVGST